MSLTIKEIAGAVAGFIPLVSTITGLVSAWVYYNRSKSDNKAKVKAEVAESAKQAQKVAGNILSTTNNINYNKLWKASLIEMIPGINIIAATYSAFILMEISKMRDLKDPAKLKDYLFEKYKTERSSSLPQKEKMFEVLVLIEQQENMDYETKKSIAVYCYGICVGNVNLLAQDIYEGGKKIVEDELYDRDDRYNKAIEKQRAYQEWLKAPPKVEIKDLELD